MKKLLKSGKLLSFIMSLVVCSVVLFSPAVAAHATDPKPSDIVSGAFENGTMFEQTENVVKKAGGSLKSLITTIAIIVLVIAVIFVGIQFTSKNSAKRQEAKSNLGAIIVGAVLIFAAVAVISLSSTIANALEDSVTTVQDGE